ncbi:MAG: hypothetical protein K2P12_01890 [Clostridia bacterium]|nr:hypothetical protein [Clostridia bacterium]
MQNEFELLPSEEQINMMNKEYNEMQRRKNLIGDNCSLPAVKNNAHRPVLSCKGAKCGTDPKQSKLFERIYFAEQDMIMALKQLYTIAPHNAKDDIADLIKIKKTNSNLALKCYYSVSDNKISYAPILSHENDYCRLLRHISNMQKQLLLMLNKSKCMCVYSKKMIQYEWTASYIITNISIYCRF